MSQKTISRRTASVLNTSEQTPLGFSPLLERIYRSRDIERPEQLDTSLRALLAPELKGIQAAAKILADAVFERKNILIVGDFDCDGATSVALSILGFRAMGHYQIDYLVPNRFEYGYGLTPEIVRVAAKDPACQKVFGTKPDLIVTVDNGIASIDGVLEAKRLGIDVVVTDHHLAGDSLPEAAAIVNPNQPGCDFASKNLAGVGVMFYLLSVLRSQLSQRQWFEQNNVTAPNLAQFLDIVALGTVADVVPLDQNNRILVKQGLERIRAGQCRPGISALLQVAKREPHRLVASDLGFAVGPRLNAAGRLDDISLGIQCLLESDFQVALNLAAQLDDLNRERRAIEGSMQAEAEQSLAKLSLSEDELPWGLCLYDPSWHQGVIGILASRIKDRYHRPVIAFAQASDDEVKGSARSIPGLHIRDALDAVSKKYPELLEKFGGHAMAAGMSLKTEHYQAFTQAFDQEVRRQLKPEQLNAMIETDGALEASELSMNTAQELRTAGPFGQHFPEPLFDGEFYLVSQRIVGEKHLKLVLALDASGQQIIDAIAFNVDTKAWPNHSAKKIRAAYKLDINEFRGQQSLQLMVDHLEVMS